MLTTFFTMNHIRWVDNNDWVIGIILLCLFIYVFMLLSLNRESSLKDFIMQPITEGANIVVNWGIVSLVFVLVLAVLISQSVPIVPQLLTSYHVMGWELNKLGFSLLAIGIFYFSKSFVSFLFYMSIGEGKRWAPLTFVATKFYFIYSLVLMGLCIAHYYFGIDPILVFQYYQWMFVIIFIFKLFYYRFNKNEILPREWYYKILYICTLQIVPLWLLWKLLFI